MEVTTPRVTADPRLDAKFDTADFQQVVQPMACGAKGLA